MLLPELYGDNPVCMRTAAEHGLSRSMRSANDGTSWESCSGHSLRFCRQRKPSPWCRDGRQDAVGGREDTEGVFQMALGADWNGSYDNAYGLNMGGRVVRNSRSLPTVAVLPLSCRPRRRVPFAGQKNPLQEHEFMQGRAGSDIQNDFAGYGNLVKDLRNVLDCLQVFGFNPRQNQHLIPRFDPGSPGNDFAAWPYNNQV